MRVDRIVRYSTIYYLSLSLISFRSSSREVRAKWLRLGIWRASLGVPYALRDPLSLSLSCAITRSHAVSFPGRASRVSSLIPEIPLCSRKCDGHSRRVEQYIHRRESTRVASRRSMILSSTCTHDRLRRHRRVYLLVSRFPDAFNNDRRFYISSRVSLARACTL